MSDRCSRGARFSLIERFEGYYNINTEIRRNVQSYDYAYKVYVFIIGIGEDAPSTGEPGEK